MASRNVSLKWGKQTIEVALTAEDTFESFKQKIATLTNIPSERQKVMLKGKFVKDDTAVAALADGASLSLLGSADELAGPAKKVVFEEDLTVEQKSQFSVGDKVGLKNLGNTCYMNATMQVLRNVRDLKEAVHQQTLLRNNPSASDMCTRMSQLMRAMDGSTDPVAPTMFLQALRREFPQFDERGQGGLHAQQDADECLSQILCGLGNQLKAVPTANRGCDNWVDLLFGVKTHTTIKLSDSEMGEEEPVVTDERHNKLTCSIDGTVNHVLEGLKLGMHETFEKKSSTLNRTAQYTRDTYISELPQYLSIQFNRFFWKQDTAMKAKIIRKVMFPLELDVFELTGGELNQTLAKNRRDANEQKEKALGLKPVAKAETDATTPVLCGTVGKSVSTGRYELTGVVTHKGRDADSGHYIGWTKQGADKWYKYDDDIVTVVKDADIQQLCGGGDWHMAYLCVYKRID